MAEDKESQRLDKWLVYARFFKTRERAAALCESGALRLSGTRVAKAHQKLRPGDVLTFPQGSFVRVVKVLALTERRGSAQVAQQLYEDLSPPAEQTPLTHTTPVAKRVTGSGRPTKKERRAMEVFAEPGD